MLATYSLDDLFISRLSPAPAGVKVETRDISLAGPDFWSTSRISYRRASLSEITLAELGRTQRRPAKPYHQASEYFRVRSAAQAGHQRIASRQGYNLPDYPETAGTPELNDIKTRYGKRTGLCSKPGSSARGNSDRESTPRVKAFAPQTPLAWEAGRPTPQPTLPAWKAATFLRQRAVPHSVQAHQRAH